MANVEKLVPFFLKWEAGTTDKTLVGEQLFEKARKNGFANDKDDDGGETMCGVTIATYKEYCRKKGYPVPTVERLKNISYKDWLAILKTMYWDRWQADKIRNQSIANLLVDWTWTSGKYGITWPQSYLGITADGIVGSKTLSALDAACNSKGSQTVFKGLTDKHLAYVDWMIVRDPRKKKFRNGWLNRINDLKYEGDLV